MHSEPGEKKKKKKKKKPNLIHTNTRKDWIFMLFASLYTDSETNKINQKA